MKIIPFWGCMIPIRYPQMELSLRRTLPGLGIELVDIDGFTCCPDPVYFKAKDKLTWITIAARNLAVAESAGLDVVTMCSGCTSTLKEARFLLEEDPALREEVNRKLFRIHRRYQGQVQVKHILSVIRDDVGMAKLKDSVTRPLTGLRVAIHYGCHLLKPSQIMGVDDADYPSILEDMVTALGATPLDHSEKLLCCGKGCLAEDVPLTMTGEIFSSIEEAGGDVMGLICPTCFSSFDLGQVLIARKQGKEYQIPVVYYFQLLGLAQGLTPQEVGLHLHRIKPEALLKA